MIVFGTTRKILGIIFQLLAEIFGEVLERIVEIGIWSFILKFYFGLTIKTAIATAIVLGVLTFLKNIYYKEDFYLAFGILLLFHENWFLSWLIFMYASYFRTKMRGIDKLGKYETLKSKTLMVIGELFAPLLLVFLARKYRHAKDSIILLLSLMFLHHLNYFVLRFIDIIKYRKTYTIKEVKTLMAQNLRDTKFNIIFTVIFIALFKNIIFTYVYNDVSWGWIDDVFYWLSWII